MRENDKHKAHVHSVPKLAHCYMHVKNRARTTQNIYGTTSTMLGEEVNNMGYKQNIANNAREVYELQPTEYSQLGRAAS